MKKIITTLTCFVFSFVFFAAHAQVQPGKMAGTVLDESKKPIEAASVALLKLKDSSLIKSGVSDTTGKFVINNIAYGKYIIAISAVEHEKFISKAVEINSNNSSINLNNILLQSTTKNLQEVSIIGKKPFFEQKADRMIVNVDASPSNAGSTVMDVLEKSPGVTVDKDGNISLKGKAGVTVMIDNRPTYLSATDLSNY